MSRTRIKICGITRVEDALAATHAGADAIGLVFHPVAKRRITIDRAREILAVLPPFVTPVGVFVDQSPDEVRRVAIELGLRHLQFNGKEDAACMKALERFSIIKAVHVDRQTFPQELARWRDAIAEHGLTNLKGLVLETAGGGPGGTGVANDWETIRAAKAAGGFEGLPSVITAGGLTPENVGVVVRDLRPWAVDVSSGVESAMGVKSREKIEAFVRSVKGTD